MFMSGIYAASEVVKHRDLFPDTGLAVVHIQSEHGAAKHHAVLSTAFPEVTSDETADVFDAILGALFEFAIFFDRFCGALGNADLLTEVFPGDIAVFPLLIHATIAD